MTDGKQTLNGNRRAALKTLAAASGAVTIGALPKLWSKPSVAVGAIPAHAQVSCGVGLRVERTGGTGNIPIFEDYLQTHDSNPATDLYIWSTALCGCTAIFIGNGDDQDDIEWTVTFGDQTQFVLDAGAVFTRYYGFNLATGVMVGPFIGVADLNVGLDSIGCPILVS